MIEMLSEKFPYSLNQKNHFSFLTNSHMQAQFSKTEPIAKMHGHLVDTNDSIEAGKRFFITSRHYPKKDRQTMRIAARIYISKDLEVSTLLQDCVSIFNLNYTPNCLMINDTQTQVEDLSEVPEKTYMFIKYDAELQFNSKRVRLYRNSYPKKDGKLYHTKKGGIDALLKDAKKLLKLDEYPSFLYLTNGQRLTDINSLPDNTTTDIIVCNDENCVFKSINDESQSVTSEMMAESPLMYQSSDIYNYILGMASTSIQKAKKLAKLAAFQMLSEKDRKSLPEAQKIKRVMKKTHNEGFNKQMATQMIVPPISEQSVLGDLTKKCIEFLSDDDLGKIQYVISGANGSGKSTFLYVFANTFVRKLTLCDEEQNYLMFPVNFEKYTLIKDKPLQLYNLFIEIGFESAKYTCFEFVQYANLLKQYLVQLPLQLAAKKPPAPFGSLQNFANEVVKCFQNKGQNIANILRRFPSAFAKAIGLTNAILVIDHFDCFGSEFGASFARCFVNTPFIVATKNDKEFFEVFDKVDPEFLYTENLIEPFEDRVLSVPELKLQLKATHCFGSPGFVSLFSEICDMVENFNWHVDSDQRIRGKFNTIRSKAELSRKFIIRQKLFKLCIQLEAAGSKIITNNILNVLDDIDQNITFNLTTVNQDGASRASTVHRTRTKDNSSRSNHDQIFDDKYKIANIKNRSIEIDNNENNKNNRKPSPPKNNMFNNIVNDKSNKLDGLNSIMSAIGNSPASQKNSHQQQSPSQQNNKIDNKLSKPSPSHKKGFSSSDDAESGFNFDNLKPINKIPVNNSPSTDKNVRITNNKPPQRKGSPIQKPPKQQNNFSDSDSNDDDENQKKVMKKPVQFNFNKNSRPVASSQVATNQKSSPSAKNTFDSYSEDDDDDDNNFNNQSKLPIARNQASPSKIPERRSPAKSVGSQMIVPDKQVVRKSPPKKPATNFNDPISDSYSNDDDFRSPLRKSNNSTPQSQKRLSQNALADSDSDSEGYAIPGTKQNSQKSTPNKKSPAASPNHNLNSPGKKSPSGRIKGSPVNKNSPGNQPVKKFDFDDSDEDEDGDDYGNLNNNKNRSVSNNNNNNKFRKNRFDSDSEEDEEEEISSLRKRAINDFESSD
ncbi:hypothetical protein TRFO_04387 [Tritrichomonas foetus]|uniref:Doublecortin domain-containing protein n=1 Tax=Tritrichomonas foetus TaxID=1144522 RepID=A0A1J4KFR5_9EUKA|nr:hypothetical protein TRFO_04387 [Tritrichomonas foetus]|eukprot:OHT09858.1 hypothetical protein TRFO_04387 [Tritrichomonas foetus]